MHQATLLSADISIVNCVRVQQHLYTQADDKIHVGTSHQRTFTRAGPVPILRLICKIHLRPGLGAWPIAEILDE